MLFRNLCEAAAFVPSTKFNRMKNTVAFFLLAFISARAFAQEKKSKFSLSAFISPTVAHRILRADNSVPDAIKEVYNDIETPKLGYSAGLLASYAVHEKVRIQTGISFSNNGYLFKKNDLTFGNQFNGTGFDPALFPNGMPDAIKIVYQHYYIDVPVQVKYTFLKKKKLSFYAVAGTEANFNLSNKKTVTFWYEDDKDRETTDDNLNGGYEYRKYNCSVTGGVGMDIALGSKVNIFVQPTYRQMLFSIVDAPLERRLYSVGLATGASINL